MNSIRKQCLELTVVRTERLGSRHVLLRLSHAEPLPEMLPGQFVELLPPDGSTLLRRPISVNWVDVQANELWLLIAAVGAGTHSLCALQVGQQVSCLFPLGNCFSVPEGQGVKVLLVGGGVGVAPLLFQGERLRSLGHQPHFLLGARTEQELLELSLFEHLAPTYTTTEDGSHGHCGRVTDHPILLHEHFAMVQTCGPLPMMQAVARWAKEKEVDCEASLENQMACGLGACLCCVEKTTEGNVCACTEGPVFNTKKLLW